MPVTRAPLQNEPLELLSELLRGRRIVALAGAGCSTESGIPDYRGAGSPGRARTPIQFHEFVRSETARARYWARSAVGWPRFRAARPNAAHEALARLEAGGSVAGVITQNVDGLHHAAGSRRVVELHGSLSLVRCLGCATAVCRNEHQERLLALNGEWADRLRAAVLAAESAPDGDADLDAAALAGFRVPACGVCGGVLKPDVVLFGENVPAARLDDAWRLFADGNVLLVIGTSLAVFSGRRFVLRAQQCAVPVIIINIGATRADDVASAKLEARVGEALPRLAGLLLGGN